jgi:pimeloyl-ACP methyl ester carboxylesterase
MHSLLPLDARRPARVARFLLVALVLLLAPGLRSAAAQTPVDVVSGRTEDGSTFAIAMPDAWNRSLIVYAHGIVDPGAPVALPSTQDGFETLRTLWTGMGYAVAYSSFAENGYALKSAIDSTDDLRREFRKRFSRPVRTYLVGHSLGALAVVAIAETHPGHYDGALAMCAPIGGGVAEIQYLSDARVLFDYFFPGVVPGGPFSVPAGTSFAPGSPVFNATFAALVGGLSSPGQPTLQFASSARLPFTSVNELIASALNVVGFSVRFSNDVLERTKGRIPFRNVYTVYTGSANDVALNLGVERFTARKSAVNFFEKYYEPTGELEIPMLTLHSRFDPVAPFGQEADYARKVANEGSSTWLTQRAISSYGHCNINPAETMSGFQALVTWVTAGTKPAGGDGTIR